MLSDAWNHVFHFLYSWILKCVKSWDVCDLEMSWIPDSPLPLELHIHLTPRSTLIWLPVNSPHGWHSLYCWMLTYAWPQGQPWYDYHLNFTYAWPRGQTCAALPYGCHSLHCWILTYAWPQGQPCYSYHFNFTYAWPRGQTCTLLAYGLHFLHCWILTPRLVLLSLKIWLHIGLTPRSNMLSQLLYLEGPGLAIKT